MSALEQATIAAIETASALQAIATDTSLGLKNRAVAAGAVQHNMLHLLELVQSIAVEKGGAKQVEQLGVWDQIFGLELTGDDVSKVAQWVEEHTPLRVKFDTKTAKFLKVKVDSKAVNAAKFDPLADPWRLSQATKIMWTDYTKETRKAKALPSVQRGIDAVIREAARLIDVDSTVTLDEIKAQIEKELVKKLSENIIKECGKASHEEFVEKFKSEQEARDRGHA
jgi:hypothetical protein